MAWNAVQQTHPPLSVITSINGGKNKTQNLEGRQNWILGGEAADTLRDLERMMALLLEVSGSVIDERPKGPIEKRERNLNIFSPVSREERETGNSFRQFREEKRILKEYAQLSRGEREMDFLCSSFEKRKRK